MRILFIFSIGIYLDYIILDYMIFPVLFNVLLLIRFGFFTPAVLLLIAVTFTMFYSQSETGVIIFIAVFGTIGLLVMKYMTRETPYAYLYFLES